MRLQVAIHRHTLPVVNIVFNTASIHEPVPTISDLLNALNAIVPLESSNGQWDLDEYAVEVAANAYQDRYYECLHFQLLEDVFKENDEVVVRGLTTDEIRDRRQGGRLQISSDGRRLVDGVAWGRRFRPLASRPDVNIPPRKRRKLMMDEDDLIEDAERHMLQLDYPPFESQVGNMFHGSHLTGDDVDEDDEDEDDEDDDDYVDDQEEEEEDDSDNEHGSDEVFQDVRVTLHDPHDESGEEGYIEKRGNVLSVSTSALFDDADAHEEEELHAALEGAILASTEVNARGHQSLNETDSRGRSRSTSKQKQRNPSTRRVRFEQSSSSSSEPDSPRTAIRIGSYPVENRFNGRIRDDSNSDDSSGSDSDVDDGTTSDSSSEDSEDSGDSEADDSTSSSGSDETSSDELDSEDELLPPKRPAKSTTHINGVSFGELKRQQPTASNPPGSGTPRTKKNNDRSKRRKRLDYLKANGVLLPDADFEALSAYDASQPGKDKSIQSADHSLSSRQTSSNSLDLKRQELLARLNQVTAVSSNNAEHDLSSSPLPLPNPYSEDNRASEAVSDEPVSKRNRLDIAGTRRMLFNSLGLRTPKTKDAEDQLRQKLTESARQAEKKSVRSDTEKHSVIIDDDKSWKNKLVVSAVECVQEGRILTPPPFPFKQHWEKDTRGQKTKTRSESLMHNADTLNYDGTISEELSYQDLDREKSISQDAKGSDLPEYSNVSLNEDMPLPQDYNALKDLASEDLTPGNIIAYRELHMNTRFEPEESEYRVARILDNHSDHFVVLLSLRDRRDALNVLKIDENGDRVYHGLEIHDEEEPDDGTRELSFRDLIGPKLVEASDLQVPASATNSQAGLMASEQEVVIPESAPAVSVPSTTFEGQASLGAVSGSTDDDELLRPLQLNLSGTPVGSIDHVSEEALTGNAAIDSDQKTHRSLQTESSLTSSSLQIHSNQSVLNSEHALNDIAGDEFTSFHEEDDVVQNGTDSMQSLPMSDRSGVSTSLLKETTPIGNHNNVAIETNGHISSRQASSQEFSDAKSQQELDITSISQPTDQHEGADLSVIPSTPISIAEGNGDIQASNSSTRSSRRIAQPKLDVTSPAAKMMKSALAGLGSRKTLNARKKART